MKSSTKRTKKGALVKRVAAKAVGLIKTTWPQRMQNPEKPQRPSRSQFLGMEPLPATFSLISILGLVITTVFTISGRLDLSWGMAFDLVFTLMFVASMMSITPKF